MKERTNLQQITTCNLQGLSLRQNNTLSCLGDVQHPPEIITSHKLHEGEEMGGDVGHREKERERERWHHMAKRRQK